MATQARNAPLSLRRVDGLERLFKGGSQFSAGMLHAIQSGGTPGSGSTAWVGTTCQIPVFHGGKDIAPLAEIIMCLLTADELDTRSILSAILTMMEMLGGLVSKDNEVSSALKKMGYNTILVNITDENALGYLDIHDDDWKDRILLLCNVDVWPEISEDSVSALGVKGAENLPPTPALDGGSYFAYCGVIICVFTKNLTNVNRDSWFAARHKAFLAKVGLNSGSPNIIGDNIYPSVSICNQLYTSVSSMWLVRKAMFDRLTSVSADGTHWASIATLICKYAKGLDMGHMTLINYYIVKLNPAVLALDCLKAHVDVLIEAYEYLDKLALPPSRWPYLRIDLPEDQCQIFHRSRFEVLTQIALAIGKEYVQSLGHYQGGGNITAQTQKIVNYVLSFIDYTAEQVKEGDPEARRATTLTATQADIVDGLVSGFGVNDDLNKAGIANVADLEANKLKGIKMADKQSEMQDNLMLAGQTAKTLKDLAARGSGSIVEDFQNMRPFDGTPALPSISVQQNEFSMEHAFDENLEDAESVTTKASKTSYENMMQEASQNAVKTEKNLRVNVQPLSGINDLLKAMEGLDALKKGSLTQSASLPQSPLPAISETGNDISASHSDVEDSTTAEFYMNQEKATDPRLEDDLQDDERSKTTLQDDPEIEYDDDPFITRSQLNGILEEFATRTLNTIKGNLQEQFEGFKRSMRSEVVQQIDKIMNETKEHMEKAEKVLNQMHLSQTRLQEESMIMGGQINEARKAADLAASAATRAIQEVSECMSSVSEVSESINQIHLAYGRLISVMDPQNPVHAERTRPLPPTAQKTQSLAPKHLLVPLREGGGLSMDELLLATGGSSGKPSPTSSLKNVPIHTAPPSNHKYDVRNMAQISMAVTKKMQKDGISSKTIQSRLRQLNAIRNKPSLFDAEVQKILG